MKFVFIFSCLVLAVVPPLFIYNNIYKDGIIGRLALAAMSFFAFGFLLRLRDQNEWPEIDPVATLLVASFAVFLMWHLFRFHSRVLNKNERVDHERRTHADRRFQNEEVPPRFKIG